MPPIPHVGGDIRRRDPLPREPRVLEQIRGGRIVVRGARRLHDHGSNAAIVEMSIGARNEVAPVFLTQGMQLVEPDSPRRMLWQSASPLERLPLEYRSRATRSSDPASIL